MKTTEKQQLQQQSNAMLYSAVANAVYNGDRKIRLLNFMFENESNQDEWNRIKSNGMSKQWLEGKKI